MQSHCLQNQPVMPQDNNYQPRVGIPNVSKIPNGIFGSQVMMNQHQQCLQISIVGDNLPMANSDTGQHQLANQFTSTQANIENIIVNNNSTVQVNASNLIADNNDNNNNNNNNNKPIDLTITANQLTSPQLGQLNIPINGVQKIRPELQRKISEKTQDCYQLNGTQSPGPGLQNKIYIKTQHGYQLLKIGVPEAGTQTAQAGSNATKTIASTTPTSVIYSVASPVSAAIANPAVLSLSKTRVLPISSIETPEISSTLESDQQKAMIEKMVKKSCDFFNNLLADSSKIQQDNTRNVKSNLAELIQDVIDDKIHVQEFVNRLERMLNSDRQPLLVDFLTKSLPQLRTSLCLNQMTIDGIRPPPPKIALSTFLLVPTSATQPSLIKPKKKMKSKSSPVTMTNPRPRAILPTGLKMIPQKTLAKSPATVATSSGRGMIYPITAATPPTTLVMPQTTLVMPPATAATPPTTVVMPQTTLAMPSATVAKPQTTLAMPSATVVKPQITLVIPSATVAMSPTTMAKPQTTVAMSSSSIMISPTTVTMAPATTQIKTYQTSSKRIRPTKKLVRTDDNLKPTPVVGKKINKKIGRQSPLTTISNIQQLPTISSQMIQQLSTPTFANVIKVSEDNKKINTAIAAKKKRVVSSIETNEEEFNDVMTMGEIDIAEESEVILSSTDKVGTKVRSCEEKLFLNATALQHKIKQMLLKHGLEGTESDVLALVSHATEQRLRGLVEKMSTISEHRLDFNRNDPRYQVTQDVRSQLRFLQEVDKAACQKREAEELALLLQASKSRLKDDEQMKLKEKAKEVQKAEMEKLQKRDADLAALQALGPRKKPKRDVGMTSSAASGLSRQLFRPRIKKICMKDLLFVLQEEQSTRRSTFLYKSYLKF